MSGSTCYLQQASTLLPLKCPVSASRAWGLPSDSDEASSSTSMGSTLLLVVGLLGHRGRHDPHAVDIDGRLSVAALNEAGVTGQDAEIFILLACRCARSSVKRAAFARSYRSYRRQHVNWNSTFLSVWVGLSLALAFMKRMVKRCLPPLISAK